MIRLCVLQHMVVAITLLASSTAHSHLLKVFAYAEGHTIHGYAYFSGGMPAAGAKVEIKNEQQETIKQLLPDSEGEFIFKAPISSNYLVVADTSDGHRAEWLIKKEEFSDGNTLDLKRDPQALSNANLQTNESLSITPKQLTEIVETAVARQIGPLRAELKATADKARLSDIIGGIGFIFGIAGFSMWWRNKQ